MATPAGLPVVMHGVRLAAAVFILGLVTFIVILDATIINVAIPHIAGTFAASTSEATWVITAYAVAEALTVPLAGWLCTRFGTVGTLIVAVSSFGIFSALCAVAPTLYWLVAFRVLQGVSGGPLIAICQTLIMRISPPDKLEMVMGMWMMTSIIAPIAGPILGGTLADTLGWRWAFYLNIPIAVACAISAWVIFRKVETLRQRNSTDYIGILLLAIWVSCLQVVLSIGENLDWFASSQICLLTLIAVLGFISFIIWEITDNNPAVDIRLLSQRSFSVSCIVMSLGFGAFFASLVLLPLWLQLGMGYTATKAGYVLALQGALGVLVAPLTAFLMPRSDPRLLMFVGLVILGGAMLARSYFATTIAFEQMILPQLAMGIGLPLFFVPLMTISLKGLPTDKVASASGLINFLRTIAGAVATAVVVAYWNSETAVARAMLVPTIKEGGELFERPVLSMERTIETIDMLAQQQGMMLAANNVSLVLGAIMLATAGFIWLLPRSKN